MTVTDLSTAAVERVLAAAADHYHRLDDRARIGVTLWAGEQLQSGLSPAALVHHLESGDPHAEPGAIVARCALPVREVDHRLPVKAGWVQVPHRLIGDPQVSDAAFGLWIALARIPHSDVTAVSPSYAWLAGQLGWTGTPAAVAKRIRRGLDDAAQVGLVVGRVRHDGPGRGTQVLLRRTKPPVAEGWERLPWAVVDLVRSGQLTIALLRAWLRWLAVMAGTGQSTDTIQAVADRWNISLRAAQQQRRDLIAAGLLLGRRGVTALPAELLEATGSRPPTAPRYRHNLSAGTGTNCRVSSKTSSKTTPPVAASAASEVTREQAAAKAPAQPDDHTPQPAESPSEATAEGADRRWRGGRAATEEEQAAGRLLQRVPAWCELDADRERWQVRSKLARWVRRLAGVVSSEEVVERLNSLCAAAELEDASLVQLVDDVAVQLITEAKATTPAEAKPGAGPRRLVLVTAEAPSAERASWWRTEDPPVIDWEHPEAADPDEITAWVQSRMTRLVIEHGPAAAARVGQKLAIAGRRTPWAPVIDLAIATICADLTRPGPGERGVG